jgi:hypothetical protein
MRSLLSTPSHLRRSCPSPPSLPSSSPRSQAPAAIHSTAFLFRSQRPVWCCSVHLHLAPSSGFPSSGEQHPSSSKLLRPIRGSSWSFWPPWTVKILLPCSGWTVGRLFGFELSWDGLN